MSATVALLSLLPESFGPMGDVPTILLILVALAAIVLIGRVVMAVAWRLLLVAIGVVIGLWVLGLLGFQFGFL